MRLRVAGLLATFLLPLNACSETASEYLPDVSDASKPSLTEYVESGNTHGLTAARTGKDVDLASLPRQPAVDDQSNRQALPASMSKSALRPVSGELHGLADDDFAATKTLGLKYLQTSGKNAQE